MQYKITFGNPLQHLIYINFQIDVSDKDTETFYLPIWRPGRYEAANYSKNITSFNATNERGQSLNWSKKTAHQWEVDTAEADEINVSYTYYAHTMDAGNSWYGEELIYINFINCILFTNDSLTASCSVDIDIPGSFQIATSLNHTGNSFIAKDYYELADSPLIASNDLSKITYAIGEVDFYIWVHGAHSLNEDKIKNDFKRFSASQVSCFGEFPEKEYHFLILSLPYKFYHGVEHAASTVICLGPGNELNSDALYTSLLGVSSHELFHAWNIIKIRPVELQPYDFTKSVTFNTGYVAEGFTTYYGDLFLSRSQVFDTAAYFNELNTIFNRHFWNYGRLNESVMTSSANLWVDGYIAGAPNKKSSIYVEGAMIALCLDLKLRALTNNEKSLDDLMRLLWDNHGKNNTGYTHEDILHYSEKLAGTDLKKFFKSYIQGVTDKATLLDECLATIGCGVELTPNERVLTSKLGVRTIEEEAGLKVVAIAPASPGEKYLSVGDIITSINGSKPSDLTDGDMNTIKIERFGKDVLIDVDLSKAIHNSYYPNYSIIKSEEASSSQKKAFELWCGQVF